MPSRPAPPSPPGFDASVMYAPRWDPVDLAAAEIRQLRTWTLRCSEFALGPVERFADEWFADVRAGTFR